MDASYDIVILAGSSGKPTPLSEATGVRIKSLIPLAGKPLFAHVVDAFRDWGRARSITVVGHAPDAVDIPGVDRWIADQGGLVANLQAGVRAVAKGDTPLISASSDIPLLSTAAIDDFVTRCTGLGVDLGYPIVEQSVMEARFPGAGRSYRRLREGSFCGGDLMYMRPRVVYSNEPLAAQLSAGRKSALKLAAAIGFGTIVRFLLGTLSIERLERKVSGLMKAKMRAIISDYPELAMDLDSPQHLAVIQRDIEASGGQR